MKVTLLELNEFNKELLEKASEIYQLSHLKKLVSMYQTETMTDDTYESDFLEPWVQWVSVHTGVCSKDHKIKHLGDVPHLENPQLWETLSENGYSSIVWGAMNASRGSASLNSAFFPDPWTCSEKAFPEELNHLLNPLRAVSTNYLRPDKKKLIGMLKKLVILLKNNKLSVFVLKKMPELLKELIKFKGAHFVFIAFVETLSLKLFLSYKQKIKPDFSLIFINTLAHIQHHHWHGFDYENNQKLRLGLKYIDSMLKDLFDSLEKDEVFIVANALSQKNTNDETPWVLYRPYNHRAFLQKIGIFPKSIKEHMTHDAHLFFESIEACQMAKELLEKVTCENKPLFFVEGYTSNPLKLFYRLQFTDKISPNAEIQLGNIKLPFFANFQNIVERTGKHIQKGTCYCNLNILPNKICNYQISSEIIKIFICKKLELIK